MLQKKFLLVSGVLTALACALVLAGIAVGVPGQWVMSRAWPEAFSGLFYVLPALALIVAVLAVTYDKIATVKLYEEVVAVGLLVVLLCGMQFGIAMLGEFGPEESFLAVATPTTNLYFAESGTIDDPIAYLQNYPDHAENSQGWQLKTHPPGPVMFFYTARQAVKAVPFLKSLALGCRDYFVAPASSWRNIDAFAFLHNAVDSDAEAAGWLAIIVLRIAAALSVVPVYLLGRSLLDRQRAFIAAALAGLVPSLLLFNVIIDQLYPLLGLSALVLGHYALRRRSIALDLLAGLVLFVGLMFSAGFIVFIFILLAYQGIGIIYGRKVIDLASGVKIVIRLSETLLIGVMVGIAGIWAVSGHGPRLIFDCLHGNALFNQASGRTYFAWLLANPIIFAAFLGVPAAVLFACRAGQEGRSLQKRRELNQIDLLAIVTLVTLLGLWLYGANLGEVERLWMPLMPLCVLLGVGVIKLSKLGWLSMVGLQGLQAIVFAIALDPLGLKKIIIEMLKSSNHLS